MPSGLRSSLSAARFSEVKEVKYFGGGGNAAVRALGGCSAIVALGVVSLVFGGD